MGYLSRRPAPPLDRWIESVWTSDRAQGLPHAREWGLPTGRADLIVPLDRDHLLRHAAASTADVPGQRLAGGALQGAMTRPVLRDTSAASIVVGAHFRPAGLAALFEMPADEVAGLAVPLDDLWPGFSEALQDRARSARVLHDPARRLGLFEQALLARLRAQVATDAMADWAWRRIAAGATITEVRRASGWSHASFVHRYRAACGLMPKQHAAVMRFQQALQAGARGLPWAEVAALAGYADQAHLSRAFRTLAGMAPGQVRREATPFSNHLRWR